MIPTFLVWGDAAAGGLKQRNKRLGVSHPIVAIMEDFRLGALVDVNQPAPNGRSAWWQRLWAAQWWYEPQRDEAALLQDYIQRQQRVLAVLAGPDPIVVWVGNNAHDKLMLAMVAHLALPSIPLAVVDITGQVDHHYAGQYAVGMCPPEALLTLEPLMLSDAARAELSRQWCDWNTRGEAWCEMGADGQVIAYPIDHWDGRLLEQLAGQGPQPASRVIGEVIAKYLGDFMSDGFLFWRLACLRQAGVVVFTPGEGPSPQVPKVALA